MSTPTAYEVQLMDTYPQQTKNYLSIYRPSIAVVCQVAGDYDRDTQQVAIDNISAGSLSDVTANHFQVALVGSEPGKEDYGRTWVRSAAPGVMRFVESDHINWQDNAYITVYKYTEIIPVFPRIIKNPADEEDVIFYKWWDVAYTNQNSVLGCVPNMGSHYAGFGTQVYWSASGTQNILGNSMTYSWSFEGANTPSSSDHTPGWIEYPGPGHYRTILTVTSSNGATDQSVRYVSLYDRPGEGPNQPYLNWSRSEFAGSIDGRGYTCRIKLRDPIPEDTVLDGALVVIFKDDWYGSTQASVNTNGLGRENVSMVGYIESGTIQYNYFDGSVEFTVVSPTKVMEVCEGFSISVESKHNPSEWYELLNMTIQRAIYHYMKWQSTIMLCADVAFDFVDRDVQYFDADRTSLYDALYSFINGTCYGNIVSDKLGKIWMFRDPAAVHNASVNLRTGAYLTKSRWVGQPIITERQHNDVCYIELGGIIFSNSDMQSSAALGAAPGLSPAYHGRVDKKQGLALLSQNELNNIVGDLYAFRNSRYPDIQIKLRGNFANLDIAPPHKVFLNLDRDDTPRRLQWQEKPFVVTGISWERDAERQVEYPTLTLAELPVGFAGSTVSIPIEPPSTSSPNSNQPPSTPQPPVTPPSTGISGLDVYYNGTFVMSASKLNFIGQSVFVEPNPDDATMADIYIDDCGCSGAFLGNQNGVQGNMTLSASESNGKVGSGVQYLKALVSGTYTINHDSDGFFNRIGTTATFLIPYTGYYEITFTNFAVRVSPNASDYNFDFVNTLMVSTYTEERTGTQVSYVPLTGLSQFSAAPHRLYFSRGQEVIVSVINSMTVHSGTTPSWWSVAGTIDISPA